MPNLLIHRLAKQEHADGQAFGLRNHYQIRLRAQLLFLQRRPQFRAMILHELGHIVNDDIGRTYYASSLWIAFSAIFLFMVGIISTVLLVSPEKTSITTGLWGLLGRMALILVIALVIWRSLLQIREYYADWRAALWGEEYALKQWLGKIIKQPIEIKKSWWQRFVSFHPSDRERAEVLAEPMKLFRISRQLPFLTGLLLAITIIGFPIMVGWFFVPVSGLVDIALTTWAAQLFRSPDLTNINLFIVANFVFKILPLLVIIFGVLVYIGYLLTTTLGVQVQRETIADMTNQVVQLRSYGRLAQSAIWLTTGVQTGLIIMPLGYPLPTRWQTILLTIAWLIGFSLLTWLWLAYVRALTQIILGSHIGRIDPGRGKKFVTLFSSISLAFLYPPAFLLLGLAWIGGRSDVLPLAAGPDLSSAQFMTINVVVLIFIAIVYFLGAALSLMAFYGIVAFRPSALCPTCGEKTPYKIVLGQNCPYCYQPMSLWIYLNET